MAEEITSHIVIKGTNAITELKPLRTWSQTNGVSNVQRFVGPATLIHDKFNELVSSEDNGADEIAENYDGAKGELRIMTADYSGDGTTGGNTEALNTVWELRTNTVYKPIESRREFDSLNTLDSDTSKKRKIEAAARDATANPYPSDSAAKKLYAYYANQVLDYPLADLMLTKSTKVSKRNEIKATYTNLNRVVTITSINPPSVLIGTISTLPKSDGSGNAGWEWLYLGPQIVQLTRSTYQILYTWHGAERWMQMVGGTWNPESA